MNRRIRHNSSIRVTRVKRLSTRSRFRSLDVQSPYKNVQPKQILDGTSHISSSYVDENKIKLHKRSDHIRHLVICTFPENRSIIPTQSHNSIRIKQTETCSDHHIRSANVDNDNKFESISLNSNSIGKSATQQDFLVLAYGEGNVDKTVRPRRSKNIKNYLPRSAFSDPYSNVSDGSHDQRYKNLMSERNYAKNRDNDYQSNDYRKRSIKRRKCFADCCCRCSPLCMILSTIAAILLAIAVTSLLLGLLKRTTTTTTTTTVTTTTTSSTSSTTSTTTTTTTTSTTSSTTSTTTSTTTTSTTTSTTTTSSTTSTTSVTTTTSTTTTTTADPIDKAFWAFDNNTLELYNAADGTVSGSVSYATSLLGYGAALSVSRSSCGFISVTSKQIPMDSRSFTIEMWIYPTGLGAGDYGLFGQCQSRANNLCLHLSVRGYKLYFGFYGNDLSGATTLLMNRWTHIAGVYDSSNLMQELWVNGVLDSSRSASPYQALWGTTTIGATFDSGSASCFNGYIDQVKFEARAKNATELLDDASLQAYFSFDSSSFADNGPNGINGTGTGSPRNVTGRLNQALEFSSGSYLSHGYAPFYFLGITNYSYSISLWVKPTNVSRASTITFVYSASGWCVHFIVFTANGNLSLHSWSNLDVKCNGPLLPLNIWTHIGYTYSPTNGMRLYINGTLFSSTMPFSFIGAGFPLYIVIGSDIGRTGCSPSYGGQFNGVVDEYYVHNREITASEVWALANP